MKHLTLKRIAATAILGTAASFAANAAFAQAPIGPQFRVGSVATTAQAIEHTAHQTAITDSTTQQRYPRFRVPYPDLTLNHATEAKPAAFHPQYVSNGHHQVGERTWLR